MAGYFRGLRCDPKPFLMNNHDGTFREEALLRGVALGPERAI